MKEPATVGAAPDPGRRRFLAMAAVVGAAAATTAVVGRRLQSATSAVADRTRRIIRSTKPLPTASSNIQAVALTTATPFFTPNREFYRIDTALIVPRIDASKWKLTVKGMVDKERTYTYEDLLSRELVEREITLTCVSNEVGGQLMGTARWVGVPLRELLDEVGADPKATQVVGRSIDGWTSGFPTAVVRDGRDAIVALSMNGEPLPFAHGYLRALSFLGCTAMSRQRSGCHPLSSRPSVHSMPTGFHGDIRSLRRSNSRRELTCREASPR